MKKFTNRKDFCNVYISIVALSLLIITACNQTGKSSVLLATVDIIIFDNYNMLLPQKFKNNGENIWYLDTGKKLGNIEITKTESFEGNLKEILSNIETVWNVQISELEYMTTDSIVDKGKRGYVNLYRKNNNTNPSGYAVYSYYSNGILLFDNNIFTIKSFSLGFNLNPNISNSLFSIRKINADTLSTEKIEAITDEVAESVKANNLEGMTVFEKHHIASPLKYNYIGEKSDKLLDVKYVDQDTKTVYYIASRSLDQNIKEGDYLNSYKENMIRDGVFVKEINFKGRRALFGKGRIESAYYYQIQFCNRDKGQTFQLMSFKEASYEFDKYLSEVILLN